MPIKITAPVLFVFTTLASLFASSRLPERVPVHWNLHGQPDRYGSRWELLLLGPGLTLVMGALFLVLERVDPRLKNEDDPGPRRSLMSIALLLMAALHVVILGHVAGLFADVTRAITLAMSLSFVLMGNVLTRVRPNWFAGIRTPWTLSSDEVWRRTHRVGGHVMFASGLLSAIAALLLPPPMALPIMLVGVLGSAAFSIVYSYVVWKRVGAG